MVEELSPMINMGKIVVGCIKKICRPIGWVLFKGRRGIEELSTELVGLSNDLNEIREAVGRIASMVGGVSETIKTDVRPEELGVKAVISEKGSEELGSVREYIRYLQDKTDIAVENLRNLSPEDRMAYDLIGVGLYIKGIEEEYGIIAPGEFWRAMADLQLSGAQVKEFIKAFRRSDIRDMSDMNNYIHRKDLPWRSGRQPQQISRIMLEALKEIYPGRSEEELCDKLIELLLPTDR